MKTTFAALVALAAIGFAGTAFAEDGPKPMTDAEMDKVTAAGTVTIFRCNPAQNICRLGLVVPIGADKDFSVGNPPN